MWRQNIGVIVLALILGLSYGGHMLYRYLKIRADSAKRAAAVIRVI
jgi:predicted alpha/beta-fold hydrolase